MNQTDLIGKFLSLQRQAVDALIDLFESRGFNDPSLALNVKVLSELCSHPEGILLGNAMAAAEQAKTGRWEALDVMEHHIALGMGAHKTASPPRWNLGGLMHLQPVLDAIKTAARSIPAPAFPMVDPRVKRVALVVSNLSRGAATTMVAQKIAASLKARGLEIFVLITGHAAHPTDDRSGLDHAGISVINVWTNSVCERAQDVVLQAKGLHLDAIIFYTWPTDIAAQIASCIRVSPRQMFINHTCDQKVGHFDVRVCYTRKTAGLTDPDRCYYVPPVRVREEQYDEIAGVTLSQWGIDDGATIIGNYSRLSKCVDDAFLMAMVQILRKNPSVILMLPGLPDPSSETVLRSRFELHGLLQQVRFPGFLADSYLPLLKATRIYCDTFTWTGGQSVLDAMAMGVPVVASEPESGGSALDPTGVSPASLASSLLPDATLVTQAGAVDHYVTIVQRLLDDPAFHNFHSRRNIERARELAWPQFPCILVELLEQTVVLPASSVDE